MYVCSSSKPPITTNGVRQYVDELGTLSTAIQQRGQMRHTEMSLAVYTAIQGLASAVSVRDPLISRTRLHH